MSAQNLVSASLPAADQQAVSQKIAELRQLLPFLVDLTIAERRRLLKMGDGSRAFVEKALAAAQNNPQVLPGTFSTAGKLIIGLLILLWTGWAGFVYAAPQEWFQITAFFFALTLVSVFRAWAADRAAVREKGYIDEDLTSPEDTKK